MMMQQHDATRERILRYGLGIASERGLKALSLGDAARDLDLPRSGLSQHFSSKDALQMGVLEQAAALFITDVVEPGLSMAVGEQRVRTLFGKWLAWSRSPRLRGGCPFVHASAEGDALPVELRGKLTEFLDNWSGVLRSSLDEGRGTTFRADIDSEQLVFELYGLYLSHHHWHWAMRDQSAFQRTMKAFDRTVDGILA
jgi:AcrR family transcriptional regulator